MEYNTCGIIWYLTTRLLFLCLDLVVQKSLFMLTQDESEQRNPWTSTSPNHSVPHRSFFTASVRCRIQKSCTVKGQSISDLTTAVASLENWIWTKTHSHKLIETMSAAELDGHLAAFFPCLRKPNGYEYDWHYHCKCRSYIDRFLRESGYPLSITKSPEFFNSQQAFAKNRERQQRKKNS